MKCFIYKTDKKPELYLYLADKEAFDCVPEDLMRWFSRAELVMEVDLSERKKMARVDLEELKSGLADKGYFLQLPPETHHPMAPTF